ncbi:hypothetical protein [Hydrogenivirga sp. 128-5-R1-1]|uniref:hypothetical protein n=1 Tax=Hydrogenivirga sp. 128-5-R1-1 TaxID=392423 RepID=UPI00015F0656|nr:hypothetical protein [Hydrogenivirga sp. 128-5-R1-1]EDP72965.1 hypothetical protein HG1285_18921 [Hydrogenivirga sp. 128-5-R1-1]
MDLEKKLKAFKESLEKEYKLLLKLDNPQELLNIIEEKKKLISELSMYEKKDFENYIDLLKEIEFLNKRNLNLANNNMLFIDEIFSSIFEENVEKYNPYGQISQGQKSGIFNKKI